MKVEDIFWDDESALLIHGETTEEEARQIALEHLGTGEFHIDDVERWRKWPDPSGSYDCHLDYNRSPSIIGTFKARLVT